MNKHSQAREGAGFRKQMESSIHGGLPFDKDVLRKRKLSKAMEFVQDRIPTNCRARILTHAGMTPSLDRHPLGFFQPITKHPASTILSHQPNQRDSQGREESGENRAAV